LETVDERAYAALKYAHSFEDVFDVTARAYYDRNDFEIGYPVTSAFSTNLFLEQQAGEWWGTEVQLSRRVWDRHTVILGAEYRDDFRQDRVLFDAAGGAPFTDVSSDRQSYGVYLQTDFEIRTNLHLSAGVRYDKYGDTDPRWNPRFA